MTTRKMQLFVLALFAAVTLARAVSNFDLSASAAPQTAQNPCAKKPDQNPCAMKNGQNPCAKKKGMNPCNPCAKKGQNPCAMKKATSEVYSPATAYAKWQKINKKPLLSEPHGGMLETTFANQLAKDAIKGKQTSFPTGAILVKETHASANGKPGMKGPIFAMEKTASGWLWVTTDATGHVMEKGVGEQMMMCAQCHAKAGMDAAFLRAK